MSEIRSDQVTLNPAGWYLPKADSYFGQFMPGPAPKKNGFMREHLLEAFKYVRTWEVSVDVGAHVGFWAWDLAHRFKTVYAFEPSEASYQCLVRNVAEFGNVVFYNVAVGDRMTTCTVHNDPVRPGNTGSFYVKPDPHGSVNMVTLDQMQLPGCDLLKIDVEGFEWNVLCGAKRLIKDNQPVVIMECTDSKFRGRYSIHEGEAERWLLSRGYREVAVMRPDKVFVPNALAR